MIPCVCLTSNFLTYFFRFPSSIANTLLLLFLYTKGDFATQLKSGCNDQIEHHASIFMRCKIIWEFYKTFAILWKVVEAVVLVLYMIMKYELNLYQKKFI